MFKVDGRTGAGLPGVVFQLTDSCGGPVYSRTDEAGLLVLRLCPCRVYALAEVEPPAGFLPAAHVYDIRVDRCGGIFVDGVCTNQIFVANFPVTGGFTAVKVNAADNAPLAGAEYTLLQNSQPVVSAVSTETGALTFSGLLPGTYELVETAPPAGFQSNAEPLIVVVAADGGVTIAGELAEGFILRDAPLGSLVFEKQNALTGEPLAGAVFSLSQNGGAIVTAQSEADGTVDFGTLTAGTYTLAETTPPSGFQANTESLTVVVSPDGNITIGDEPADGFVFPNVPLGEVSFSKTDATTGSPLAGAVFTLSQNGVETATATSDAEGLVNFGVILPGTYELTETASPSGYQTNDAVYQVVVGADGSVTVDDVSLDAFSVENVPVTAAFTATKVDIEDGEPLAGATYTLLQNSAEITSVVSTVTGAVAFTDLSPGTYELVETIPPTGYQTDTESLEVVVAPDGTVTIDSAPAEGYLLNDVPLGSLAFEKQNSSTSQPLAGAVFILSQDGVETGTATSDDAGLVDFGAVLPGVYELEETIAPSGFVLDTTAYEVIVGADGTITVGGISLENFVAENVPQPPPATSVPPEINPVTQGALVVTGTGVGGSNVEIVFPGGNRITALVDPIGDWSVDVPGGENLVEGEIIYAYQTEIGKLISEAAQTTVLAPV